ncbi:MAG: ankyrin repeat domain-containing protein [Bdellovibrionota bacterium]
MKTIFTFGLVFCGIAVGMMPPGRAVAAAAAEDEIARRPSKLVDTSRDGWEQDVNARLLAAAEANDLPGVESALADGAVADAATFQKQVTALMFACRHDNLDMAKAVLDAGADPDLGDVMGETALFRAVEIGDFDLVDLLFFHSAKVNVRNVHGATPLMRAVGSRDDAFLTQKLISRGAHLNCKRKDGRTALMVAIEHSHLLAAARLLENDARHQSKDRHGRTALSIAAENGCVAAVQLLLTPKHCTKLNAKDKLGQTPLIWAVIGQKTDAVRALVEAGAKTNREDDFGRTAYQWAVFLGNQELQDLLKP